MANRMGRNQDLEQVIAELERATVELSRAVKHQDPSIGEHLLSRGAAAARLEAALQGGFQPGHLQRLQAVAKLGEGVADELRRWTNAASAELAVLRAQSELVKLARAAEEDPMRLLDMTA